MDKIIIGGLLLILPIICIPTIIWIVMKDYYLGKNIIQNIKKTKREINIHG